MGMITGERKGVLAEMNVVPLIDILLVLLIIFMVISPLTPQGLDARIPQPERTAVPPHAEPDVVVVQVGPAAELRINQEPADWDSLGARLSAIFARRGQRIAFVQGDSGVEFRHVARAIDIMRSVGIESVGLITQKM